MFLKIQLDVWILWRDLWTTLKASAYGMGSPPLITNHISAHRCTCTYTYSFYPLDKCVRGLTPENYTSDITCNLWLLNLPKATVKPWWSQTETISHCAKNTKRLATPTSTQDYMKVYCFPLIFWLQCKQTGKNSVWSNTRHLQAKVVDDFTER